MEYQPVTPKTELYTGITIVSRRTGPSWRQ